VGRDVVDFGFAAVLVLLAAWVAGELLVLRRVRNLVLAAGRLAEGDLTARTGLPYGLGEIGAVARAFDEMAERLQRRETDAASAREELRRGKADTGVPDVR
jgi:HAMP domain-containing protein